jgi:hypothetical protein
MGNGDESGMNVACIIKHWALSCMWVVCMVPSLVVDK